MPEERVGFKYRLWRIVESTPFEYFIMTLIVLNTILLMMKVIYISTFLMTCYSSVIAFLSNQETIGNVQDYGQIHPALRVLQYEI